MRQPLGPGERRSVEEFARGEGVRCNLCGSTDLRCDDTAAVFLGVGYSVRLICTNEEVEAHAGGLGMVRDYSITADDARRIGLG